MNKLRKNDLVQITLGKDKGKSGKIARVDSKAGRIYVEGVNLSKRHVKKMGEVEGGIIDIIKSINLSNVNLVCPSCKKLTRVGFKLMKDGSKSRVCKKCHKEVDNVQSKK